MERLGFARACFALGVAAAFAVAGGVAIAQDNQPAPAPPMFQRVDDLESAVQRLTGQVEELQHQNQQLQQKVDRLQRALDYQNGQQDGGAATSPSDNATSSNTSAGNDEYNTVDAPPRRPQGPNSAAGEGLAPGPTNLGSMPAHTPMPLAKPGGNGGTESAVPAGGGRVASLPPASGNAAGDYEAAMALLRKAQYDAAQQAFRAFADAHPADAHAADALFWTGDIAYSAKRDYANAARAFVELLKKYGKSSRAPEAMLKLGLSLLALGQKQEGCATLAAFPSRYANAPPALVTRASAERTRAACT